MPYLALAPLIGSAFVSDVLVTRPGETVAELRTWLFQRPNITTPLTELDGAFDIQFQDELQGFGSGTVTLGNEDPDLPWIWDRNCCVRMDIHGRPAFTWLVEEIEHRAIDSDEEHGEVTILSGRGHLAVLDEAVVYPASGLDRDPFSDDRVFSWPSYDYDDSWWGPVVSFGPLTGNGTPAWYGVAGAWPDSVAQMVWVPGSTVRLAPGGTCYFRRDFEVAEKINAQVTFTVDDIGTLWIDGQEIVSTSQWGNLPSDVVTYTLELDEGRHVVAVEATNSAIPVDIDGPFNPSMFALSITPVDKLGNLGYPVLVTNDTWRAVPYPPHPPGMTPGEVMRHVIQEAQARGCFTEVTLGFTDDVDSNGVPWPERTDISTRIGTTVATFIIDEMGSTWVDVWMPPGAFELRAAQYGTRGVDRNVTLKRVSDEHDPMSGNLAALTHRGVR